MEKSKDIYLSNFNGNELGPHQYVSLSRETDKGLFIITCPKNSLTNKLVQRNLDYDGIVTFHELGLTPKQVANIF